MANAEKLENQEVLISMASGTALRCLYEKLSCKVCWDHTSLGLPLARSAEVSNVRLQVVTLVTHISKFSHVPKQRVNRQRQLGPGGFPSSATLQAQARQDPEVKPGHQF